MKWIWLAITVIVVGAGVFCSERWLEHQRYSVIRTHKAVAYQLDHETGRVHVLLGYKAHPVLVEANPSPKTVSSLDDLDWD